MEHKNSLIKLSLCLANNAMETLLLFLAIIISLCVLDLLPSKQRAEVNGSKLACP